MSRVFQIVHTTYRTLFSRKYLLATNLGLSVLTAGTGAGLQQRYDIATGGTNKWSWRRIGDYSLLAGLVTPLQHHWYIWLDRAFPPRGPLAALIKVTLDTLVISLPLTAYFLGGSVILTHGVSSYERAKNKIVKSGPELFGFKLLFGQTCQAANFYLVPVKFRLLCDYTVALGIDIYTSAVIWSRDDKQLCSEGEKTENTENTEEAESSLRENLQILYGPDADL
jgi:hypothetical protein